MDLPPINPIELKIKDKTVFLFPSVHNSLPFCVSLLQLFETSTFDKVLLEFPRELTGTYGFTVRRLPIPSLIHKEQSENISLPSPSPVFPVHMGDAIHFAAFLASRKSIDVELIDRLVDVSPALSLSFDPSMISFLNWGTFFSEFKISRHLKSVHFLRSIAMSESIASALSSDTSSVLVITGLMHVPVIVWYLSTFYGASGFDIPYSSEISNYYTQATSLPKVDATDFIVSDIHPHTYYLVSGDFPFLIGRVVELMDYDVSPDLFNLLQDAFLIAGSIYSEKFEDTISPATLKKIMQYLRNLTWLENAVFPSLSSAIFAAKGMVDDDYAFELFRILISYPFFPNENERLPSQVKIIPNEEISQTIKMTFKRRMKRPVLKRIKNFEEFIKSREFDDLDPIPEELYPGHWKEIWDQYSPFSTVSYPPEDKYIENYFQHLRKKGQEILQEEKSRIEEFRVSMEDGIAWRETIRNLHENKIFVKHVPKTKEEIGALIVQFVENPDPIEFDYHSVLYAEHDQESDISIVSTSPGDIIVGPGITRIKIAAVISVFPPEGYGVPVPKSQDDLKIRLLYTAMRMARSKNILLVSPKPPSAIHRHFIESEGFRLLYHPMSTLPKSSMHRLRIMHLLAHPDLRDIAREYIGY